MNLQIKKYKRKIVPFSDYINNDTIKYLESEINYTIIYLKNGSKIRKSYTLKRYEEKLINNESFIRINRKIILNVSQIKEINEFDRIIVLKDGLIFSISRRRYSEIINKLENVN